MKLSLSSRAKCPCCRKKRTKSQTMQLTKFIDKLYESYPRWCEFFYSGDKLKMYKSYTSSQYGWACDTCITEGLVLVGNPCQQEFMDWPPYFTYHNQTHVCRSCEAKFLFSKEEQLYWYETLKFWVQSDAVNCKTCRAEKRARRKEIREAQKLLAQLIPALNTDSTEELENIIKLYQITDSRRKIKHYSNILNKLQRKKF